MNSQSIKSELISRVSKLKDKKLLHSLSSVKDSTESGDWYTHLTSSQKKSLEKGIEEHKKGQVLTSRQFGHDMSDKLDIAWSNEAVRRTDEIIKYLKDNWSAKEIESFLDALESFEEMVSRKSTLNH